MMQRAKLPHSSPGLTDVMRLGPGDTLIDENTPLGPVQVHILATSEIWGRRSSLRDEAECYLGQVQMRDNAFDDEGEADANYYEEAPQAPDACIEVDAKTGARKVMTREAMMEHVSRNFAGSGALWLQRVLAFDRWKLDCLQLEAKHKLPQLQAHTRHTTQLATDAAWRVLDKPAETVRDVAVKLGVFMLEIGEVELKEDDAKPLRQLCAELLRLASA